MHKSDERAPKWRVLYTKPRAEKCACDLLKIKGYEIYLPCVTVVKQWSDRKKKVKEPLFKSYLFINCTLAQIEEAARNDKIVGVVRFDGRPAVVREQEMQIIRQIESGNNDVVVVNNRLVVGKKVAIKEGKLKGFSGVLTEFRGAQRVAIEIESLGCNLLVEVPLNDITEIN